MRQMLPVTAQRRRMGRAGGLGSLILLVAILCSSCAIGVDSATEPSRDEAGHVSEEGDLSVFHLRVGDCTQGSALGEVASVGATPCDQPHAYEVFATASVEGEAYDSRAIDTFAQEACTREFATFVGVPVGDSVLDVTYLTPTADSFSRGDREVTCLVGAGAAPSTGTLRGTRR